MCMFYVRRYAYPTKPHLIEHTKLVPCKDSLNGTDACINVKREVKTITVGPPRIVLRSNLSLAQQRMKDSEKDAAAAFAKMSFSREAREDAPPSLGFSSNATASPSMPSTPRSIPPSPTGEKVTSGSRQTSSRYGARLSTSRPVIINQPNPPSASSTTSRRTRTRWQLPSGVSARTRQHYSDSEYEFAQDPDARPMSSAASSGSTARLDDRATEITDRSVAREELRREEQERRRREREEQALDEQEIRTQDRMQGRERLRQELARQREREDEERRQHAEQAERISRHMDQYYAERLSREEREKIEEQARENVRLQDLRQQQETEAYLDSLRQGESRPTDDRDLLESERRYQQRLQETLQERERERERARHRDIIADADATARRAEEERQATQERIRQLDELSRRLRQMRVRENEGRRHYRDHENEQDSYQRLHRRNSSSGDSSSSRWSGRYWGDGRGYYNSQYLPHQPPPPPPQFLDGERFNGRHRLTRDPLDDGRINPSDLYRPSSSRGMEDPNTRRLRGQEVLERARRNAAQQAAEDPPIGVPLLSRRNTVQRGGDFRDRETRYRDTRRRYF